MHAPERLKPTQLPDPWLIDTNHLMAELTRIRELALRVPVTPESYGPTNTVVDAVWDLQQRLQFLIGLQAEMQRNFARKAERAATQENVHVGTPKVVRIKA